MTCSADALRVQIGGRCVLAPGDGLGTGVDNGAALGGSREYLTAHTFLWNRRNCSVRRGEAERRGSPRPLSWPRPEANGREGYNLRCRNPPPLDKMKLASLVDDDEDHCAP